MANQNELALSQIDKNLDDNNLKWDMARLGLMANDYLNGIESDWAELMEVTLIDYPEDREKLAGTLEHALKMDLTPNQSDPLDRSPDMSDRDYLVAAEQRLRRIIEADNILHNRLKAAQTDNENG